MNERYSQLHQERYSHRQMPQKITVVALASLALFTAMRLAAEPERDLTPGGKLLRLSFPGMHVRATTAAMWAKEFPGYPIVPFFQHAQYYEVTGAADHLESFYAGDVSGERPDARRRLVQVKVISSSAGRPFDKIDVAMVNYTFPDVTHCAQCIRLCKVVMLSTGGKKEQLVTQHYLEGTNPLVQDARFQDLNGDGTPELIVEVGSWSDHGVSWTSLNVFSILQSRLALIAEHQISLDNLGSMWCCERYEKKLDIGKTQATDGRALIFQVKTFTRDNRQLSSPEITWESIPLPTGMPHR
jgi:hypothetical protein